LGALIRQDDFLQLGDRAGFINSILQIIPETDIILTAGSHEAEEDVGGFRPGQTPMTVADFPLDHLLARVQLARIVVERGVRKLEDGQEFRFLAQNFFDTPIQGIVARVRLENLVELPKEHFLRSFGGGEFKGFQLVVVGPGCGKEPVQNPTKIRGQGIQVFEVAPHMNPAQLEKLR